MTAIDHLLKADEWKKFQRSALRTEPFNLFELIEEALCENSWSRMLAFLFDSSEKHLLGTSAFLTWCRHAGLPASFVAQLTKDSCNLSISTESEWGTLEKRRVDILVKVGDGSSAPLFVLGIENKVWTGESPRQLSDYQEAISKSFPRSRCYLIFLSPDGRQPTTACSQNTHCPCVSAGYGSVISMCADLKSSASQPIQVLLESLSEYIRKHIMGDPGIETATLAAAREFFLKPENRRALELIQQCRELLPDIKGKLEKSFHRRTGRERRWEYYPEEAQLPQEFKLEVPELAGKGFSVYYLVRCEKNKPFFGDKYRVLAAAYSTSAEAKIELQPSFPLKSSVTHYRNWDHWIVMWVGQEYELRDLSDRDADALAELLHDGIKTTSAEIRKILSSPSR